MLNFGFGEIVLIMVLAIVVVGPDRLPEMLRFVGKQYGKVMRASNDLRRAFMLEADRSDAEKRAVLLRERREQARMRAQEAREKALEMARDRAASVGVTGDGPPATAAEPLPLEAEPHDAPRSEEAPQAAASDGAPLDADAPAEGTPQQPPPPPAVPSDAEGSAP